MDAAALNRDGYDAIAARWDAVRVRLSDPERQVLERLHAHLTPGCRVLDLGCGTGRPIAEGLVARGARVTGVDQSAAMLAFARRRLPDQHWVLAPLESFEPQGRYAAAVAWDSLFHIPRAEHEGIVRRVHGALDPGGLIALTVGGSAHPAFTDTMFDTTLHYDSHPPDVAEALLERLGFVIVAAEYLSRPTGGRDKGRYAIVARAG